MRLSIFGSGWDASRNLGALCEVFEHLTCVMTLKSILCGAMISCWDPSPFTKCSWQHCACSCKEHSHCKVLWYTSCWHFSLPVEGSPLVEVFSRHTCRPDGRAVAESRKEIPQAPFRRIPVKTSEQHELIVMSVVSWPSFLSADRWRIRVQGRLDRSNNNGRDLRRTLHQGNPVIDHVPRSVNVPR